MATKLPQNKKDNSFNEDVLPIGDQLDFYASESYNTIRTNLYLTSFEKKGAKVIGIVSADPQEGKSVTSINISYFLAKDGNKVLLIEGDLRRPTLKKKLTMLPKAGLSDVVVGKVSLEDAIEKRVLIDSLSVLFSGPIPPNPSEILGSATLANMIKSVEDQYDYIIFDLPPINSVIDSIALSPVLDGFVFVSRYDYSEKKRIVRALSALSACDTKIIGFVCTGFRGKAKRYYKKYRKGYGKYSYRYGRYGYGNGYGYEKDPSQDEKGL